MTPQEIEALKAERDEAMREASELAMSIWRAEFQKLSPDFELCDSPAGIISQIDNMYAAIRGQRDELAAQLSEVLGALNAVRSAGKKSGFGTQSLDSVRAERLAWMKLNEVVAKTPQQSLNEIRAESLELGKREGRAERDALVAKVDDLEFQRVCAVTQATNMFDALRLAIAAFDKYEMSVDDYPSIEHVRMRERLYSAAFLNADKHLAEIRAEYGRAGFIAGFNESGEGFNGEYGPSEKRIYELANEYIESLR